MTCPRLVYRLIERFKATPFLGWSAWMRITAALPLLVLLWLAVWWASMELVPL
jgi:hypothetical protein